MSRYTDYPKLSQHDSNPLNISKTCSEIEAAIKSVSLKKSLEFVGFSAEIYQTFKEELIPKLLKFVHQIEWKGTLLNSFYEANSTLIPKPGKDIQKGEIQPILLNECR
jgi:hypothetical protein